MIARQTLGALALLVGARTVFAAALEPQGCTPVTVTNVQYCTVSVLETITELLYATVTVTVGSTVDVTDTVSLPFTTVSVTTTTVTTGIYSNVTVSAPTSSSVLSTMSSTIPSSSVPSSFVPSSSIAPNSTVSSSSAASTAVLPTACANSGIDFAYYTHNFTNGDSDYTSFDVDYFKTATPELVNVTNKMGLRVKAGPDSNHYVNSTIYDSALKYRDQFMAINHHAYLFAIEAGTYEVSAFKVDDAVFVWVGDDAYSGWNRSNAAMEAVFSSGAVNRTYKFTAAAGDYVPLRFLFAQAQGVGGFDFTLTSPSGIVLVSSNTTSSPYIFRFSCDGVTAPPFPAFGAEY